MDNVLEIIIRVVDNASQPMDKVGNSAKDMGDKIAKGPNVHLQNLRRAAIVAVAALYGLERGLEAIVKRAGELGFKGVVTDFDTLKASVQQLGDVILTSPLFGQQDNKSTVLSMLDQGFKNLIPVVRAFGVVIEMVAGGLDLLYLGAQRLVGIEAELFGATTKYTEAWYEAAKAQSIANHNMQIGLIWEGKLTESIKASNAAHQIDINLVNRLAAAQKRLNDQLQRQRNINDAIRAGDARAFRDASAGGTGRMSAGTGMKQGAPHVSVNIGGRAINDHIMTQVVNTITGGHKR